MGARSSSWKKATVTIPVSSRFAGGGTGTPRPRRGTGSHWIERAGGRLAELPPAALRCCFGITLPAGGGAYFRLFPYALVSAALRDSGRRGVSATFYIHPLGARLRTTRVCEPRGRPVYVTTVGFPTLSHASSGCSATSSSSPSRRPLLNCERRSFSPRSRAVIRAAFAHPTWAVWRSARGRPHALAPARQAAPPLAAAQRDRGAEARARGICALGVPRQCHAEPLCGGGPASAPRGRVPRTGGHGRVHRPRPSCTPRQQSKVPPAGASTWRATAQGWCPPRSCETLISLS